MIIKRNSTLTKIVIIQLTNQLNHICMYMIIVKYLFINSVTLNLLKVHSIKIVMYEKF